MTTDTTRNQGGRGEKSRRRTFSKVLIVGAGPSGLLLALLLCRAGIKVQILEAESELDPRPRAAHYGPAAVPDFIAAGILDEIHKRGGFTLETTCWRNVAAAAADDGEQQQQQPVLAVLDSGVLASVDVEEEEEVDGGGRRKQDLRTRCLVMQDLNALMLDKVLQTGYGEVSWRHRVVNVFQADGGEKKAWVECDTSEGRIKLEADYVVGCDGATSQVRKSLFGDEFPGFTWDAQIVATNTYYDFAKYGYGDVTLGVHPDNFFVAAKIAKDGLFRFTYGETPGLSEEEYRRRQPAKFKAMLPGKPDPSQYNVISMTPYKMHQRCAPSFRVGRVLLVADAAHLCNPWGGMGITGGFCDVGGLADCLIGIWKGKVDDPDELLDLYSAKRIEKWKEIIDPMSQENFRRVSDKDPGTRYERDPFMQMCKKAETDEDLQREMSLGALSLRYDFKKHFKKEGGNRSSKI